MADITMCLNKSCPERGRCVRYLAYPNEYRQAYADFKDPAQDDCFIEARGTTYVRLLCEIEPPEAA